MSGTLAPCFAVWSLIREARRRAGLTQVELADLASTTQSTISAYEQARRLPTIPVLAGLLEACGFELAIGFAEPDAQREAALDASLARSVEDRWETNESAQRLIGELRYGLRRG